MTSRPREGDERSGSGPPIRVLFVCLGNICRSPLAEGIFRHLAAEEGLEGRIEVDSAGTSTFHLGEPPDGRTRRTARSRGIEVGGTARQVEPADFERFDYLIAMDESNRRALDGLGGAGRGRAEVRLLREFDPQAGGDLAVPDPYFGGARGFEDVHDIVERSARGLLGVLRERHPELAGE